MNRVKKADRKPLIGITMGDAAGVGPELCARALASRDMAALVGLRIFGDQDMILRGGKACGITLNREQRQRIVHFPRFGSNPPEIGHVSARCGRAALIYIEAATTAAMQGKLDGIVTCPINKQAMHFAGIPHPGHTELLQTLTGAKDSRMMFLSDSLKISLVTIHVPLQQVPRLITPTAVFRTIELTHKALVRLGNPTPRIEILGLNPHAGENGILGKDECRKIVPAIMRAGDRGWKVYGPCPPDTAFTPAFRKNTDAYVAMYHDQGLIPFKMEAFDMGVNVTLGLPIVRTSVDHGTAYDIAGTGKASPTSLFEAIRWAVRLATSR